MIYKEEKIWPIFQNFNYVLNPVHSTMCIAIFWIIQDNTGYILLEYIWFKFQIRPFTSDIKVIKFKVIFQKSKIRQKFSKCLRYFTDVTLLSKDAEQRLDSCGGEHENIVKWKQRKDADTGRGDTAVKVLFVSIHMKEVTVKALLETDIVKTKAVDRDTEEFVTTGLTVKLGV